MQESHSPNKTPAGTKTSAQKNTSLTAGINHLEASWGRMTVEVSEDFMTVHLQALACNEACRHEVSAASILELLQKSAVAFGLRTDEIKNRTPDLLAQENWQGHLLVAQGRPPGEPGEAEFTLFTKGVDVCLVGEICLVGEQQLNFKNLWDLWSRATEGPQETSMLVKAVGPGEIIAKRQEPLRGRPGRDILGRNIAAPHFSWLLAEENVIIVDNRRQFESTLFGYLLVLADHLSVLSPIRIADNDMTAWWVCLPQMAPYRLPNQSDIINQLEKIGVRKGVDKAAIAELIATMEPNQGFFQVVAKGQEPEPGAAAYLDFSVPRNKQAGLVRSDDSIDLRELNLIQTVDEGELIATLHPSTPGVPGFTLSGEVLPAEPGEELKVEAKENVRAEEGENGEVLFFAECAGMIIYKDGKIRVDPALQIKGDIDFSTGNIDVQCSLEVTGNVCADFHVTSSKNVIIGGSIEHGAKVVVQGDMLIKGGIIGENTNVTVLGNLETQFIQAANVVVKGSLTVKEYIYTATVRTVGEINVGPGSSARGGTIVGGTVCSSSDISLTSCGSPSNVPTTIAIEPAPHLLAKLLKLRKDTSRHDSSIIKIMRTLNLRTINSHDIKAILDAQPPSQREFYIKILTQLNAMVKFQQSALKQREELTKLLKQRMEEVRLQVDKTCYGNCTIRMGRHELHEKTDRGPSTFSYRKSAVHVDSRLTTDTDGEGIEPNNPEYRPLKTEKKRHR